jgi:hypothetical protein
VSGGGPAKEGPPSGRIVLSSKKRLPSRWLVARIIGHAIKMAEAGRTWQRGVTRDRFPGPIVMASAHVWKSRTKRRMVR